MGKYNVYLDDKRSPDMSHNINRGLGIEYSNDKWVIVRDYFEFVKFVSKNFDNVGLISFDHDLACFKDGVEYTGKSAVDFLINFCIDNNKDFPNWYVHTDNTVGRSNIIGIILNYIKVMENFDISDFRYYNNGIINGQFV
jgi:hypothetical protein